MFDKTETREAATARLVGVCAWGAIAILSVWGSVSHADDAASWYQKGDIPVTVTLTNVSPVGATTEGMMAEDKIYVSIQTEDTYRSLKGHGGILTTLTPGTMEATFYVAEPGDYAVSVWHDRDNDMRFSMDENYNIQDGWGASGTPPVNAAPTFNDVKIDVPNIGTSLTVPMRNPG